ncbi:HTTM domain-containing protein [Maribacter sp. 2-571]|uniref:HTTM domain-containing protein n=1 Tax=Maribacter sp. 2-571 TaxID=3417569 RepID=UPI003D334E49
MIRRLLFGRIDNSPLIIFRVFFGILCALECYGAIVTGWVRRTLVEPEFTFNFIGFEWLQPLPGVGMYVYFAIMGTLGVGIALGYRYRFCAIAFTLLWTGAYLMQKTSYNNHYYLLVLISGCMAVFPANRYFSLDVKRNPNIRTISMPGWIKWSIVLQLFIVYTYAAIAKMYGDWVDFGIVKILMQGKAGYPIIGSVLQLPWIHKIIGVFGILFDLLIIPALLWKPTRKPAFIASIFFHLFNSIVFQIGIFPYLSLAFTVFFFDTKTINNLFFKKKPHYSDAPELSPAYNRPLLLVLGIYFLVQIALPLRHHLIPDDVLWTEEGHRLSWRMMLRSRAGRIQFQVVHKDTQKKEYIDASKYLTAKQRRRLGSYPDFIWQFAQKLKAIYAEKGIAVSVYAIGSKVSVNGKPYRPFIDPTVDLAAVPWSHLHHNAFILPSSEADTTEN